MPIGRGSRYDPATGERQDYEFKYTPASQMPNYGGMQFDMRKAMEQLGVKQAEQAMIAATRYQGQRGYQQDLQQGISADRALAKWGPLMFFGSSTSGAGSMINALKPPPPISQYQQGLLDERKKLRQLAEEKAKQPNIHWGPQGQALQVKPDGTITEVRPPNPSDKRIPLSYSDSAKKNALMSRLKTKLDERAAITPKEGWTLPVLGTKVNSNMDEVKKLDDEIFQLQNELGTLEQLTIPKQANANVPVVPSASTPIPVAPKTPEVKTYSSEEEARKAGAKNGDIVYLKGIGRVRLK